MSVIKLAIVGAGELGLQLLDLSQNAKENFIAVGFFDDTKCIGENVAGVPILGGLADIESVYAKGIFDKVVIAIGYNHMVIRSELFLKLNNKIQFATLIHKSCIVNDTVIIGNGSVLYPGCIIDKNVEIGNNVLLNLGVVVSHDCKIGNNSFIAPRVVFSGFAIIGYECFIGTNATIIDNIKIGNNVYIGAGSVVINNVPDELRVMGNPARSR